MTAEVAFTSEEGKEAIKVTADELEHLLDQKLVVVQGNVVIEYAGITLKAERAELNIISGDVKASGNIQITGEDSDIRAESLQLNLKSLSGTVYDARGVIISTFYFTAKKMAWFGKERFNLEEGSFTSCPGPDPDWVFKVPRAEIRLEDKATFRGVSFWVKGVPVLYLPFFLVPTKTERSSGFLVPKIGFSDSEGFVFKNRYFWAISDQMDTTIGLDYFSRRGLGPNLEYRYLINKESFGELHTSYIKDKASETDFYNLDWKHQQRWENGIRNLTRFDFERKGFRQRFEDDLILRTRRMSDSYIFLGKNWSDFSLWLEAEFFRTVEIEQRESFSRQPEISLFYLDRKIGNWPVYFSFDSSYVSFMEESGPIENREHRADFMPTIKLPLSIWPYLTYTLAASLREAVYSTEGVGDTIPRRTFLANMTLQGPIVYKEYQLNSWNLKGLKHYIEPKLNYSFISQEKIDYDQSVKRKFDLIDEEENVNLLSFDLDNRFLAQSSLNKNHKDVWQIANLSLGIDYDLSETKGDGQQSFVPGQRFSPLRLDLKTFSPGKWEFNLDAGYKIREDKFVSRNVQFIYTPREDLEFSIEKRFNSDQHLDYLMGKVKTSFSKNLVLTWFVRYDEENSRLAENNIGLEYKANCWSIHLSFIRRTDATKFFFYINLKGLN